jgi:hypothetical protein
MKRRFALKDNFPFPENLQIAVADWTMDRRIGRHGWSGVAVGEYRRAPFWAYTLGFDETLEHPELIVFDLPKRSANAMFHQVYAEVKSGALVIEDGLDWPADAELPATWRKVDPSRLSEGWLTMAERRRYQVSGRRNGLEAYQLVLRDPGGHLPFEPGYDASLRRLQAALYLPREAAGPDEPSP